MWLLGGEFDHRSIRLLGRFREASKKNLQFSFDFACAHVTSGYIARMKNTNNAMTEWANYNALFNGGANRAALLKAARAMKDSANRKAALLNLGVMTATDKKQIDDRWKSINAVTKKEMAAHCQFDGLPAL